MIRLLTIASAMLVCVCASAQTRNVSINSLNIANGKSAFLIEVDGESHLVADKPQIYLDDSPISIGDLVDVMLGTQIPTFEIEQDPMNYGTVSIIRAKSVAGPVAAAEPVYETVRVTTGYRTVCENGVCRRVPIVEEVRRLVLPATDVSSECCPTPTIAVGSPAPGNHQHTDSQGNVWEHSDANVGNYGAHLSPFTGELIYGRSACSGNGGYGGSYRSAPVFRGGVFQGIRSRWGLRRQGRFTKLENYSATGERSFPLLSALMPKAWLSLTL